MESEGILVDAVKKLNIKELLENKINDYVTYKKMYPKKIQHESNDKKKRISSFINYDVNLVDQVYDFENPLEYVFIDSDKRKLKGIYKVEILESNLDDYQPNNNYHATIKYTRVDDYQKGKIIVKRKEYNIKNKEWITFVSVC